MTFAEKLNATATTAREEQEKAELAKHTEYVHNILYPYFEELASKGCMGVSRSCVIAIPNGLRMSKIVDLLAEDGIQAEEYNGGLIASWL
jgi:hypothetical protein